jgi:monoamine oxidase
MLSAHVGGRFARDQAAISDAGVQSAVMSVLQDMFGTGIPSPTAIAVSRWLSDPFSLGSYSFVPIGGTYPTDHDTLAEPASDRLLFAGEATSRYFGTAHGAMLSGEREAGRILPAAVPGLEAWGRWTLPAAMGVAAWLWDRRRSRPETS